jgi:hypothetical protein
VIITLSVWVDVVKRVNVLISYNAMKNAHRIQIVIWQLDAVVKVIVLIKLYVMKAVKVLEITVTRAKNVYHRSV